MDASPLPGTTAPPARTADMRAVRFIGLTFVLSFAVYLPVIASAVGWLDVDLPPDIAALGIVGPGVAALVLMYLERGPSGVRKLLGRLGRFRLGPRWWAASLAGPPALVGATYLVYLAAGGSVEPSAAVQRLRAAGDGVVWVLPALVLVTGLLALAEELGWRGYLLPVLQARWSALGSSLGLGVAWFVWHLPLAYLPGGANAGFPLPLWGIAIVSLAVVYTWLFNNTRGSLLAVTLFHAGLNVWGSLVALHPSETGELRSAVAIAGTEAVLAVTLVVLFGGTTLVRTHRR